MTANRDSSIARERFEDSIRLAASLLVLASAIALLLTQKLYGSSFVLMLATLVAWSLARKPMRSSFWEVASFCYLAFFFLDLFRLSSSLAPALVHLFVFIIINKLFNLYSDRDYYQLYLLTFLCILAAS